MIKTNATTNLKDTNLHKDFCDGYEEGDMREDPVDISAIIAFNITEEEMREYREPQYAKQHWSKNLKAILKARKDREAKNG